LIPTACTSSAGHQPEKSAPKCAHGGSFDRPETNARALPDLVAEGLGHPYPRSLERKALTKQAQARRTG